MFIGLLSFTRSLATKCVLLKSDSHVPENFCQIKIFPINEFKNCKYCFPEKQSDLKINYTRL